MASTFKWLPYATSTTAIASATLNALASGTYAWGAEIDNSATLYTLGDLTLSLSSAVTSVAPAFLTVFVVPNIDGNYIGSSGNPGISFNRGTFGGGGGSIQYIQVEALRLPPNKYKIAILNSLGVALPATNTSVCSLYRYAEQAV